MEKGWMKRASLWFAAMMCVAAVAGCVSATSGGAPQPQSKRGFCTDPTAPGCSPGAGWIGGMGP
jgi:hypothetical protein